MEPEVFVSIAISASMALFSGTTADEPGFGCEVVCQAFVTCHYGIFGSV
jgi:hypothetical protein